VDLGGVGELFDLVGPHSVDHERKMMMLLPDDVRRSLDRDG
jgi:hypothetical protein